MYNCKDNPSPCHLLTLITHPPFFLFFFAATHTYYTASPQQPHYMSCLRMFSSRVWHCGLDWTDICVSFEWASANRLMGWPDWQLDQWLHDQMRSCNGSLHEFAYCLSYCRLSSVLCACVCMRALNTHVSCLAICCRLLHPLNISHTHTGWKSRSQQGKPFFFFLNAHQSQLTFFSPTHTWRPCSQGSTCHLVLIRRLSLPTTVTLIWPPSWKK